MGIVHGYNNYPNMSKDEPHTISLGLMTFKLRYAENRTMRKSLGWNSAVDR